MALNKIYKLHSDQFHKLILSKQSCIATDKITVEGELVEYMYRDQSTFDNDSGWRFFSGTEDQHYVDDPANMAIYELNTIANYDPVIIKYLDLPVGTHLERLRNSNTFQMITE